MSATRLSAAWINSLPTPQRLEFLSELSDEDAEFLLEDWRFWARREQLAPKGSWRIWLFLGGRGSGKTRAGAEWIANGVARGKMRRIALIGATFHDARSVMIEGESGLLSVANGAVFEPSNARILWPSGAIATVLSAEEPDCIRGHQFDACWADEFAKWSDPQAALDMALMALRLGRDPRMAITTTPRNIPALKMLMDSSEVTLTQSTTRANAANLAPGFIELMEQRYGGTRLGRQELQAELIDDNERALWQRSWIEEARVARAPALTRIVVAVDPPATSHGDECGIVVAGRAGDEAYVLADHSAAGMSPAAWAKAVIDAYEKHDADFIVAEANQGGDMVKAVLLQELPDAPVKLVHATRGKRTRAEPIAQLYEQSRVHHVGAFAELEDQMCQYDGAGPSPDRMDALVWALTELFPNTRKTNPKVRSL